ncbi:hypothetical protein [Mycobacterium heckeshornense]|uniref:hypothetical protein n=1 Tax=Mycobacterium heckeshornense TaxID=110505 RepID=UPI00128F0F40|nr:hypothetical protein [Mycobacterium heckeshornense]
MASEIEAPTAAKAAVSDEDKAKAAAQHSPTAGRRGGAGPYVRYTGVKWAALTPKDVNNDPAALARIARSGTYREITPAQWAQIGVKTSKPSVWCLQNNYKIPASAFIESQLDYLLDVDGDFDLVDSQNNPVPR